MDRRLAAIAALLLLLGVGLMVPFEGTLTRIVGVVALLSWIVVGVFAIATPETLGEREE